MLILFCSDQQTFIMMVPLRNSHAYVQSRPSVPSYTQQSTYSVHKPQPTPTVTYSHSAPAEENAQLHAPHSTIAPAISSQLHYSVPSYSYQHSTQPAHSIQYTPQQVQIQQSIEYPSRHEYYHAPKVVSHHSAPQYHQAHFQPSYHYGSPQLDFFGAYNKQHSSLLDSYIPSSVILDRQRTFLQKNQVYQPSLPLTNHISAPNTHSFNGYNTIAYSTPLGYNYNHLKRSPSLPVSTKLKPKVHKATKLTKVSSNVSAKI